MKIAPFAQFTILRFLKIKRESVRKNLIYKKYIIINRQNIVSSCILYYNYTWTDKNGKKIFLNENNLKYKRSQS
jgi:hypothetical protein